MIRGKKQKGMIFPIFLGAILIVFLFLSLLIRYSGTIAIVRQVENRIYQAVIDVLAENWDKVYSSIREGYSGAYSYDINEVFSEVYSLSNAKARINQYLSLTNDQQIDSQGKVLYEIKNIKTNISNISFKDKTLDFHVQITADLKVPIEFLGYQQIIEIPIDLKSKYSKKF